jgi:hypothetical protein
MKAMGTLTLAMWAAGEAANSASRSAGVGVALKRARPSCGGGGGSQS